MTTLNDLVDEWTDDDHPACDLDPIGPFQRHWAKHGWFALPGLLDEASMGDYEDAWLQAHGSRTVGGWPYVTAHRDVLALARLVCHPRIALGLDELLGEPAGVHLTLTGWVTTTRDWHQDCYLNPPGVGAWYVGAWIALDDIDPDSGPFQFIDRSHLWPPLSQAKVRDALGADGEAPDWPRRSEALLSPLFEERIVDEELEVVDYLPKRGDVLFWHSRLLHRGSRARVPGTERRALIAHYSGANHRSDMPPAERVHGGLMFPVDDRHGLPAEQLTGGVR